MGFSINKIETLKSYLTKFRYERDLKFKDLDVAFMKALETNDSSEQSSIALTKNTLRNYPNTITLDSFETKEELRALWPSSILDVPTNWDYTK